MVESSNKVSHETPDLDDYDETPSDEKSTATD